jgi:hypothetical protein
MKIYQVWARKNENFPFVITEVRALNIRKAKKYLIKEGYKLDSKIYLKK